MKKEDLKQIVKEKYGSIASQSSAGCGCGCSCGDEDYTIFSDKYDQLQGYAQDADLGLGCGLPTEYASIKPGDHVLDLGSGAGNDCFVARAMVGDSGHVTGLDFTQEMIEKAEMNNLKLGYKNIDFILGDIEQMPLQDDSYDVVISNCVINLVPDKSKAFAEINRVLKPGAHFCISDVVLSGQLTPKLQEAAELYAGCVSGALQKDEYLEIIKSSGFNGIEIRKEKKIEISDSMLLKYLTQVELDEFHKDNIGIFSITVVAKK